MEHVIRDAHTHFFSHVLFETLAREAGTGRPAAEVVAPAGLDLPPDDHLAQLERWLMALDLAGVESVVSFASVPEEAEVVGGAARLSGGRMTAMTVVNPQAPGAVAFVERALDEWGHRGIVLFPSLHRFSMSDDGVRPVLEVLRSRRALCLVHCGMLKINLRDLFGLTRGYDARHADPLALVRAAGDFPEVPFVIPHFGGGMFANALLAASWCKNIWFDTSSSNDWMKVHMPQLTLAQVFGRALEVVGPGRILYGSDSSSFPRGYRIDLLRNQHSVLLELGLGPDERDAVLGGNLEQLLTAGAAS